MGGRGNEKRNTVVRLGTTRNGIESRAPISGSQMSSSRGDYVYRDQRLTMFLLFDESCLVIVRGVRHSKLSGPWSTRDDGRSLAQVRSLWLGDG